jgi:N-hydroxyarylamine O-acetyltransferase
MHSSMELGAYFERIAYRGLTEASANVLSDLLEAHLRSIPFENVDVLLGREIRIDLEGVEDKLVRRRRGGYCFEQGVLFRAVLERLGFPCRALAARVRFGAQLPVTARLHMVLAVEVGGREHLVDPGFGGPGSRSPIPLISGAEARGPFGIHRLIEDRSVFMLQGSIDGEWRDLYCFTRESEHDVDFEVANHYMSTHPKSRFRRQLVVHRATPTGSVSLLDQELTQKSDGAIQRSTLAGGAAVREALVQHFGIDVPEWARDAR